MKKDTHTLKDNKPYMPKTYSSVHENPFSRKHKREEILYSLKISFSSFYQYCSGNIAIPRSIIKRLITNGLPEQELNDLIRSANSVNNLTAYFLSAYEQRIHKAAYWNDIGLKKHSAENYLAATQWAIASLIFANDETLKQKILEKIVSVYKFASTIFENPAECIEIPYLSSFISAYLRLPSASKETPSPLVILYKNLFSLKEELYYTENSLLNKGFATLSFDYPGDNRQSLQGNLQFDPTELTKAIFSYVFQLEKVDAARIYLYGIGLGSRLALYSNFVLPNKIKALSVISMPINLKQNLDLRSSALAREKNISITEARTALLQLSDMTPFDEHLSNIELPFLVAGGGLDRIALSEDCRLSYQNASSADKKLIFCPSADHELTEQMPSFRHELAEWLKQRT